MYGIGSLVSNSGSLYQILIFGLEFSGSLPPLLKDLRNMKDVYDLTLLYYSYVTKTLTLRVTTLLYKTFAEIVA